MSGPCCSLADDAGAGRIGALGPKGIGGFFGVMLTIGSFVMGLLGWLLIMKKKALQCSSCQAVFAASEIDLPLGYLRGFLLVQCQRHEFQIEEAIIQLGPD